VDLNNQYLLSAREDAAIKPFIMDAIKINYLDKKQPWSSVLWSMIMPGLGQLSINRIISAFFILSWWIAIVYYSNLLPAIHSTFMGSFMQTKHLLNIQWGLNIPSVYFYTMYDAYINTVESNKLFEWEQAKYLKRNYQHSSFTVPTKKDKGRKNMYIVSVFEHSVSLEKAITSMQMKGITEENILAVPMDKRGEKPRLFDSIQESDGLSLLDLPFILGSIFTLFGGIYGFILAWGQIIWGLIGLIVGFALGLVIKLAVTRKYLQDRASKPASEVVLIIECEEKESEAVRDILWTHNALGLMLN
jgi:hypothetical protein